MQANSPTGSGIRLIAVDLDGTLLHSDSSLSPKGGRALAAAASQGICVVLTTTRTLSSVRRYAAEIGIDHPVVCTNGAHVLASPTGPTWISRIIPEDLALTLLAEADARGWELITTVRRDTEPTGEGEPHNAAMPDEITVYRQRAGQKLGWQRTDRLVVAHNLAALDYGRPIRILTYQPPALHDLIDFCASHFPGQYHLETYLFPDESVKSIGLFAARSDKGTGLAEVMTRLGIAKEAVMAIGDNPNDLPMFGCAGLCVAMGNASSAVRRAASVVAPSNDEDGVAWAVSRFVLGGNSLR